MGNIIIKSKKVEDHLVDLKKLSKRLRRYSLKLNLTKCAFKTFVSKLLEFIVSKKGMEIDPTKIKVINFSRDVHTNNSERCENFPRKYQFYRQVHYSVDVYM
mgnify:CR=1 FL=1